MNILRKTVPFTIAVIATLSLLAYQTDAAAPGPKVSDSTRGNKHNLSAASTGVTYKATDDPVNNPRGQQICIFCHTPHSANVAERAPLWSRAFSSGVTFQRYTSATLHIRNVPAAQYGAASQPNGSSKLCLSCHDGVSKLGDMFDGSNITMSGSDVISGIASFNPSTNKMLKGHHPVSFVYLTGFNSGSQSGVALPELAATGTYRFLPISSAGKVKLSDTNRDSNGWMQCTTCHDPHQNQSDPSDCYNAIGAVVACGTDTRKVAPFWVYHGTNTTASQDMGTVCKVCHASSAGLSSPGLTPPWQYPNP